MIRLKNIPKTNKFYKIFNKNTIKLSYSCTKNMGRIIKSHNKKVTTPMETENLVCACRPRDDCPIENTGQCKQKSVVYKCVVSVPNKPDKVYIGLTEGTLRNRHIAHKSTFRHKKHAGKTTLSSYIWKIRTKDKIEPNLFQ